MAHLHRFFVPPDRVSDATIFLPSVEAHHAIRVVRLREGDDVVLFDGEGREIHGTVSRLTRREVETTVRDMQIHAKPAIHLTLIQAWLQRDKCIEELIRRGTELGVTQFRFFNADHSQTHLRIRDKWRRWAIDSCKQCGRTWLPEFDTASSLNDALDGTDANPILIASTELAPPVPLRTALDGATDVAVVVGPEGDFSPAELDIARDRGVVPIALGEATLRAEAAALTAVTLILYELGGLGPLDS